MLVQGYYRTPQQHNGEYYNSTMKWKWGTTTMHTHTHTQSHYYSPGDLVVQRQIAVQEY